MKYRRYQIKEIAQRIDDKLGQVWAIVAKPIDLAIGFNGYRLVVGHNRDF